MASEHMTIADALARLRSEIAERQLLIRQLETFLHDGEPPPRREKVPRRPSRATVPMRDRVLQMLKTGDFSAAEMAQRHNMKLSSLRVCLSNMQVKAEIQKAGHGKWRLTPTPEES